MQFDDKITHLSHAAIVEHCEVIRNHPKQFLDDAWGAAVALGLDKNYTREQFDLAAAAVLGAVLAWADQRKKDNGNG